MNKIKDKMPPLNKEVVFITGTKEKMIGILRKSPNGTLSVQVGDYNNPLYKYASWRSL